MKRVVIPAVISTALGIVRLVMNRNIKTIKAPIINVCIKFGYNELTEEYGRPQINFVNAFNKCSMSDRISPIKFCTGGRKKHSKYAAAVYITNDARKIANMLVIMKYIDRL